MVKLPPEENDLKIKEEEQITTQEKLIKRKLSLLELAEFLQNISQACRINGCSRQHFYDIKKGYEEHGIEGLRERSRRKPRLKNKDAPEVEEAVLLINIPMRFTSHIMR